MHVHVEHGRTFVLVRPIGSFYGGDETDELERKLGVAIDDGTPVIVVDLSRTLDLNSTAIGILVGAHRRAVGRGSALRLCRVEADLQSVLAVLKLVNVIPLFDTFDAALAAPLSSAPQSDAAAQSSAA
jgi:anti-anti-sigma factor